MINFLFRMIKLSDKMNSLKDSMKYFCQYQWIFSNKNSQLLQNQMNHIDRQVNNEYYYLRGNC
jgi:hypothetical protein